MATVHKVQQGEDVQSISHRYGFLNYLTVWEHPKNGPLKRLRTDPNLLFPGDFVFIPDKTGNPRAESTTQRHTFQIKPATKIVRIALEDEDGKRLANLPYMLKIGTQMYPGTTDGSGMLEKEIPIDAQEGELRIDGHVWQIQVSHLNPVENVSDQGISGIKGRLRNLGYEVGSLDGEMDEITERAIRAFQRDNGLPEDGECKGATLARLIERHGG